MSKYRKKPVVIEAFQLTQEFLDKKLQVDSEFEEYFYVEGEEDPFYINFHKDHAVIQTLEGVLIASVGDYIITGVKGEKYPCKPDIFEATYELA